MIIYKELMAVLVAGVTETLHRLVFEHLPLIPEAPVANLIRPRVLGKVPARNARRPSFEHEHFHTLFGEFFCDPAAARSRADNKSVVDFSLHQQARIIHADLV